MPTVATLIKSRKLVVVQKEATVFEATRALAEHRIGAAPVIDKGRLVGIFSERDLMTRVVAEKKDPAWTPVDEVMTTKLVVAHPHLTHHQCLNIMEKAHVRHLPVVDQGKLVGMLSLRDLVELERHELEEEIHWLKEYIQYEPPGLPH